MFQSPIVRLQERSCKNKKRGSKCSLPISVSNKDIEPEDYVVVKLTSQDHKQGHEVYYVGSVIQWIDSHDSQDKEAINGWQVQCMRCHDFSYQFSFKSEDISIYATDAIVTCLSLPKIAQSVYHFSSDELMCFGPLLG